MLVVISIILRCVSAVDVTWSKISIIMYILRMLLPDNLFDKHFMFMYIYVV